MTALTITITPAGIAAAVNATNTGTGPLVISQIALLSGPATEIKRIGTLGGDSVADNIVHVTITDETTDTYTLRGLRLITDGGVIFASYDQATPILEKGAEQLVLLSADIVLTSVPPGSVTIGGTGFAYPPATTTRQGIIEIATDAEAQAGTDTTRAITPAGLQAIAATAAPAMNGAAATGTAKRWARSDHVHPSDTSKAGTSGSYPSLSVGYASNADTVDGWHAADLRAWGSITGRPNTVAGYGITDALVYNNWGTYSINISGSALSAQSAVNADTVDGWHAADLRAWGNLSGKPVGADLNFTFSYRAGSPQYVWGTTESDVGNSHVYATANLSVAYATSAASATSAGYATSAGSVTGLWSSPGSSGAFALPGGVIEKHGLYYIGDLPAGRQDYSVIFPISFPTACDHLSITIFDDSTDPANCTIDARVAAVTAGGFTLRVWESAAQNQNITIHWVAKGR